MVHWTVWALTSLSRSLVLCAVHTRCVMHEHAFVNPTKGMLILSFNGVRSHALSNWINRWRRMHVKLKTRVSSAFHNLAFSFPREKLSQACNSSSDQNSVVLLGLRVPLRGRVTCLAFLGSDDCCANSFFYYFAAIGGTVNRLMWLSLMKHVIHCFMRAQACFYSFCVRRYACVWFLAVLTVRILRHWNTMIKCH